MKRRGGVMLLTIVVLAAVTALLAAAVGMERAQVNDTVLRLEKAKARIAAESGISRAMSVFLTQQQGPVSHVDDWFALGNQSSDLFRVGDVAFRLQVIDACSLVNLNAAPEGDLQNLGLTVEQIDSLLDWRETGTTPRTDGAKDDYYNALPNPYNAGLRRLDTVDEVMLIKGFDSNTLLQTPTASTTSGVTPRPLYAWSTVDSFSPSSNSGGQQPGNINTVQANQLTQAGVPANVAAAIIARRGAVGGQFTTLGQALQVPGMNIQIAGTIVDNFMIGGQPRVEGKINVNTASEDVLMTVNGMTSDVAQSITSRQDAGMQNLSEVLQVPGFTLELAQQTIDRFTTTSEIFIVRVEGQSGSARVPLEAVISLNGGQPRIVKVYDAPLNDMTELWGWPTDTTNEVVLTEEQ